MSMNLTPQMIKGLNILSEECDYEDEHKGGTDNFILRSKLSPGVGDKSINLLLELGLIEQGMNKWFNKAGYRITSSGRAVIE